MITIIITLPSTLLPYNDYDYYILLLVLLIPLPLTLLLYLNNNEFLCIILTILSSEEIITWQTTNDREAKLVPAG